MKIAIIAHSLYPIAEPFAGGLEKITQSLVNGLVDKGHQVSTYAKVESEVKGKLITFPTISEFNQIFRDDDHQWLGIDRDEMFQTYIYTWAINHINANDYDIIHNHSLHYVPIASSSLFGEKFITTFHTPIFTQLRYGLLSLFQPTSTFTSISKFQKTLYTEFVDSHVVYNGIDVDKWDYNIDKKEDFLFWMGRICPEKAPHQAIEACIKSNKKLVLAGPISNEEYYEKEVAPLLSSKYVEYVGHLNQKEINEYLKNALAYLFTSTWDEPYGLTLAESLACATPVIAYNVGAASEIINNKCGIIIEKESITQLIEAISDIEKINYQACRDRAVAFCGIAQMLEGYQELYNNIYENSILRTSSRVGTL